MVHEWMDNADFTADDVDDVGNGIEIGDHPENVSDRTETAREEDDVVALVQRTLDDRDDSTPENIDEEPEPPLPPNPLLDHLLSNHQETHHDDAGFIIAGDDFPVSETIQPSVVDETEEVFHTPKDSGLTLFYNALAVWEEKHSISRAAHAQLVEVLQLAETIEEIQQTPKWKDTLKSRLEMSLPLRKLRSSTAKLDIAKLPTRSQDTEKILAFDLGDTLGTLLSSTSIAAKVYTGMARFTDGKVRNPWETPWWGESVRTTSGKFFNYPDGKPLFPSDFIAWSCTSRKSLCSDERCETEHLGRIKWCGEDHSTTAPELGKPLLFVQKVFKRTLHTSTIPSTFNDILSKMCFSQLAPNATELIIVEDDVISLTPQDIIRRIPGVKLNYHFSPKIASTRTKILTTKYTVRNIFNIAQQTCRPLLLSSPHRAELEIRTLGRHHFETEFAGRDMISLPLQLFVDAFGLYRNMYRSILGMYFIPQFFPHDIRVKRSSVLTATLGPYGTNLPDVFRTLFHTTALDQGAMLEVNGKQKFAYAFVSAIIGDMPSQQALSGCQGPAAKLSCRYCMVNSEERQNLDFNTVSMGRYHDFSVTKRQEIQDRRLAATTQKRELNNIGLLDDQHLTGTLTDLFPALDILRSRPADAAHSEYAGISKYIHRLFFQDSTSILTLRAADQASQVYRYFPVPPGWGRLQSPRVHSESFGMQEYGRGAIILPVLLRCWLQDTHIKKELHPFIRTRARDYLNYSLEPGGQDRNFSVAEWVVIATWTFARSMMAVCGQNQTFHDRANLRDLVVAGRRAFQFLCQVKSDSHQMKAEAAVARKEAEGQRQNTRQRRAAGALPPVPGYAPSMASTHASGFAAPNAPSVRAPPSLTTVATAKRRQANPEEKSNEFLRWKALPNVHIGLHLPEIVQEYGSCTMVFTLLGEDKHRYYFVPLFLT